MAALHRPSNMKQDDLARDRSNEGRASSISLTDTTCPSNWAIGPTELMKRLASALKWPILLAVLGGAVLAVWSYYRFGSVSATRAFMNGNVLYADPPVRSLGVIRLGESRTVGFSIRNLTARDVKVLGVRTTCGCLLVGRELPITIGPKEVEEADLVVTPRRSSVGRPFQHAAEFYLDAAGPRLILQITASVEP